MLLDKMATVHFRHLLPIPQSPSVGGTSLERGIYSLLHECGDVACPLQCLEVGDCKPTRGGVGGAVCLFRFV
jgi:hypothetical protein